MLIELQSFERHLYHAHFSNNKPTTLLELLEVKENIILEKELLVGTILNKILPLSKKNKKDVLGYCIQTLDRKCLSLHFGIPWQISQLQLRYSRYTSASIDLSIYISMTREKLNHYLNELANSCEPANPHSEIDWESVVSVIKLIENRRLSDPDSMGQEALPTISLTKDVASRCIGEIISENVWTSISELSEVYTYLAEGLANTYSMPTRIFDRISFLCSSISLCSDYDTTKKHVRNTLENIKEIYLKRESEKFETHKSHNSPSISINSVIPPLTWQGKGTELLDLFVTLQEKGFIELPGTTVTPSPTWESVCRAICGLFDLSKFRRADSTGEPWETLVTYFKTRTRDKLTGEVKYDKLRYDKRKFDSIPYRTPDLPSPK